jgi:pyrimidine-nucleoside phosphorylase
MSGRGLGHTGGTLDKLESIPGFRVELADDEFLAQVQDVGVAIVGQTADLVPADKRLYALRDVTATVDNVSLIAASVMSKKIAAGADAIVLDVKVGDGAFMKAEDDARELALAMLDLGRRAGRDVVCELTDMDQPLGRAVGNALEVREARDVLAGDGPPDLRELVLRSAAQLVALSDLGVAEVDARGRAERALADGSALRVYEVWIEAQGGDPDPAVLDEAPVVRPVPASADGYVDAIATTELGRTVVRLGGGRARKDDPIDHAVGVVCHAKRGDAVQAGRPLADVYARDDEGAEAAAAAVAACYRIAETEPEPRPLVVEVLT